MSRRGKSHPKPIRDLFPKRLKSESRKKLDNTLEFDHPMQRYIATELENVRGLKKQMSVEQCERIIDKFSRESIHQTLLEMENFAPLQKKYRSVYLTLRNWLKLKKEREQGGRKGGGSKSGWVATWDEALRWMQRNDLELDHNKYFEPVPQPGSKKPLWKKK